MSNAHVPASRTTEPVESAVTPPPGLVGDVARFIYEAAPRPVPEIALAGAIGFIAGIAGRAFNVSGEGLNHYVLLLANTGTGKEAIKSGIDRIVASLADPLSGNDTAPHVTNFIGPADMASGPGLLKATARRNPPSFVSIIGEFGLRFRQMADDRANSADASLLRVLLDLYHKSGLGRTLGETVYSDKDKNTVEIKAPAVSLIGESTPDTFYSYLNERMIANGLLPRFTIIEYRGPRPARNRKAGQASPDPDMLHRLARLVSASLNGNSINRVTNVTMTAEAEALLDQLDEYADAQINLSGNGVTRELWNRAHLKALKLAALIAVGCDHELPTITIGIAAWARDQIERDIRRLIVKFDSGEVGEVAGDEVKQTNAVLKCVFEYMTQPYERFANYGMTQQMHRTGVFTQSYLSRRLLNMPTFKGDRIGASAALKRVIRNLLEGDELRELPKSQVQRDFGVGARAFAVSAPQRFVDAGRIKFGTGV